MRRRSLSAENHWRFAGKALGENDPSTALSLSTLAEIYEKTGDDVKAEAMYRQVLEIQRKRSATSTRKRPRVSTSWRDCTCSGETTPRRNRSTSRHWKSIENPWGKTTHGEDPQQSGSRLRSEEGIREGGDTLSAGDRDRKKNAGRTSPNHRQQHQQSGRALRQAGGF